MSKWRDHVINRGTKFKRVPQLVSPGGRVEYRDEKLPQLPPPESLIVDYPFVLIDNWEIRFFPMKQNIMDWLAESASRWSRQRKNEDYRKFLTEFVSTLESVTMNPPVRTYPSWP